MSLQACVGDSPVGTPGADGGPDAASNTDAQADAPSSDAASDAPPSSVTGTVIDERSIPIAGADVRIAGADAKTDSSGKFTVTAPSTYDVLIVNSTTNGNVVTTSGKKVTGFFGLSSRTPTLQVTGATTHSTTVTVNTTGVTPPLPNGDQWYVVTAPSNLSSSRLIGLSPNNVSTPSTINWEGNARGTPPRRATSTDTC